MELRQAQSVCDVETARELFEEYARALDVDLCFQNLGQELAELPGRYAPPTGRLLLAWERGRAAGCVALRKLDGNTCEMKRLYVRLEFRSQGLGRRLVETIMDEARSAGYTRMRLDTLPSMREAIALYSSLGFKLVDPYCYNPVEGVFYMECDLQTRLQDRHSELTNQGLEVRS